MRLFSAPPSVKPCRKHACIVYNQQISLAQQIRKFTKHPILPGASLPIHMKHSRPRPIGERLLGDASRWQVVLKIRNQHERNYRLSRRRGSEGRSADRSETYLDFDLSPVCGLSHSAYTESFILRKFTILDAAFRCAVAS